MIERLCVIGATGDLAGRYLLPALVALESDGRLPAGFAVTAAGRDDYDDASYRDWAEERLDAHAPEAPHPARDRVLRATRYRRTDATEPASLARVVASDHAVVVYLALPPAVQVAAVSALAGLGLPAGSRIALEKPFGESLASARHLNRLLAEVVGETEVFRVDHFLAMPTVQNVLGLRFANRVLEPVWNAAHVEAIDIVWEETLDLQGRAGYYDGVGALVDMIQNHLLQVLCLVAMEPPRTLGERAFRDRKLDVLRAVRSPGPGEARARSRRARYRGYVDEPGVDPERETETFAELLLEIPSWRWAGTRFRLRTGKALDRDRKEIVVHFRRVPHLAYGEDGDPPPNRLRLGLEPERVTWELSGSGPDERFGLTSLRLAADLEPAALPPYARLLLDVLIGASTLSIRGDEAEESWRVIEPVQQAWRDGLVPLEEYDPGSAGPPELRATVG